MINHQKTRQEWLSLLAKTPLETLQQQWQDYLLKSDNIPADIDQSVESVRPVQIGLLQVRGRIGGNGSQFNLGDMTVTRAAIICAGFQGFGYCAGRSHAHAELIALLDALLQNPMYGNHLQTQLLKSLAEHRNTTVLKRQSIAASTVVDFFTVVRGED